MVGVSACLLGIPCRFDGKSKKNQELIEHLSKEGFVPICPEVFGGLPIPREPSFIDGGVGEDVWDGRARVVSLSGDDLTDAFKIGAELSLFILGSFGVSKVFLKEKSPSCGVSTTYSTGNRLVSGSGVAACLFKKRGLTLEGI